MARFSRIQYSSRRMSAEVQSLSQEEIRKKKRADWISQGLHAYPTAEGFRPTHRAIDLQKEFGGLEKEELEKLKAAGESPKVAIAGRVMLHRSFGKSTFLTIHDRSGKIQIFAQVSQLPAPVYEMIKHIDLGDIVYAEGHLFKTRTGELTVEAAQFRLQAKSILPLPEKFHGLADVELKYRMRYLDFIISDESKEIFIQRSKIIQYIRNFFNGLNNADLIITGHNSHHYCLLGHGCFQLSQINQTI